MPKMSMTMEEGTMVAWLKSVGDPVKSGEPVAEVATDKVDMEVESPYDGVLSRIVADIDDVIKVGEPIGYITSDSDDLLGGLFDGADSGQTPGGQAPAAAGPGAAGGGAVGDGGAASTPGQDPVGGDGSTASSTASDWPAAVPLARSIASDRGVELSSVAPTGPGGIIRVQDVESAGAVPSRAEPAASAQPSAPSQPSARSQQSAPSRAPKAAGATDPVAARRARTRLLVARTMTVSASIPQFTAYRQFDLSVLAGVRKSGLGGASWTAILVKAQAIALSRHPELNAVWTEDGPERMEEIGIALAVDSPSGLLAPVIRNPQSETLPNLSAGIAQLVDSALSGSITAGQLSGGTSVFSNLGGMGVDHFNALLTPPHATALSAGSVAQRVVATADGAFGPRLTCTVGLTMDHRVADGADAARYLQTISDLVASPDSILAV
nr:dihydrolipoamide acetyltransferase family protein [Terrimesophilobacter mesophilus]